MVRQIGQVWAVLGSSRVGWSNFWANLGKPLPYRCKLIYVSGSHSPVERVPPNQIIITIWSRTSKSIIIYMYVYVCLFSFCLPVNLSVCPSLPTSLCVQWNLHVLMAICMYSETTCIETSRCGCPKSVCNNSASRASWLTRHGRRPRLGLQSECPQAKMRGHFLWPLTFK